MTQQVSDSPAVRVASADARSEETPLPVAQLAAALQLARNVAAGQGAPPADLTRQLAGMARRVAELPPELLRGELEALLLGTHVPEALQWLHQAGLLAVLLPELEATVSFTQEAGRRHKDVWEHTKQVVAQAVPLPALRWAALLHDVGKVPTRAFLADGKVTFHGHAEVGARMFDRIARRFAFPRPLRERVRGLILHHLRANQYDGSWTDAAVRRFDRQMGDLLEELLLLSRADITSARQHKRDLAQRRLDELQRRIASLRELDAIQPPLPSGLGDEIMRHFALAPGRAIGDLKRQLEAAIERGELEERRDAEYYLSWLAPVVAASR
ncbi:MAG: HD domain-containing protein [Proteobacteria bacterium]|nr:HD domain-containing protein [Pseudomonadota bacterium]